jgi:hypothetical protein
MNVVCPKAIYLAGYLVFNTHLWSIQGLTIADGAAHTGFQDPGGNWPEIPVDPPFGQNKKGNRQPESKTAEQEECTKKHTLPHPGNLFGTGPTITALLLK